MKRVRAYTRKIEALAARAVAGGSSIEIAAALDGQAWKTVRDATSREERQATGIFFTPSSVAQHLAGLLGVDGSSVVLDPACGAGDLLLAAATTNGGAHETDVRLEGADVVPEFTALARARLKLLAVHRGWTDSWVDGHRIVTADGLRARSSYERATHVVMNPPFATAPAPSTVEWRDGAVSLAARFVGQALSASRDGTVVVAVLPEVLRSGSGYRRWREQVAARATIEHIETQDRFNADADVHTFVVRLVRGGRYEGSAHYWSANLSDDTLKGRTRVGDLFNVSVGPVVDYRSPYEGLDAPFLRPANSPAWGVVAQVSERRRFAGRLIDPPFVVVRRTSRPEHHHRAVSTLILSGGPYAIENHLLVLTPKDARRETCLKLMAQLQTDEVNSWLNDRIRCRHLTVAALRETPLESDSYE